MERSNWLLLALAAAKGDSLTPAQLQKSLFLLGKEMPDVVGKDFYAFQPYHYGPFDASVYSDAEKLQARGLVRIEHNGRWRTYAATSVGLDAAVEHARNAGAAVAYVQKVVSWVRSISFAQMVRAIYEKYPEMKAKSVFQG